MRGATWLYLNGKSLAALRKGRWKQQSLWYEWTPPLVKPAENWGAIDPNVLFLPLQIDGQLMSRLSNYSETSRSYLNLVAQSPTFSVRKITRVLVSKHKGYIFIQTDQPIYKALQLGKRSIQWNVNQCKILLLSANSDWTAFLNHFFPSEVQDILSWPHITALWRISRDISNCKYIHLEQRLPWF